MERDCNHFNISSKIFIGVTKNMVMRSKALGNAGFYTDFSTLKLSKAFNMLIQVLGL